MALRSEVLNMAEGIQPSAFIGTRSLNHSLANEAETIRIFRDELAAHFQELFALMKKLCKGVKVRKHHPKTGEVYPRARRPACSSF